MTPPIPALEGTVGRPIRPEPLVLPGTRLEPRADPEHTAALAVRIVEAAPHGALTRYEIEITGLEPGTHDLRDHLVRSDGTPTSDLPPLPVTVTGVLAPGLPRVAVPGAVPVRGLGGYTAGATAAVAAWLAGLALLVWLLRRQRRAERGSAAAPAADRLAGLVTAARSRDLTAAERAEAERLVYDAWRRYLGLLDADPRDLVAALRRDAGAARAIDRLAAWLHAPGAGTPDDVAALVGELVPVAAKGDG
ncbi:MAG: hypothetical protein FJ309_14690 [Planctomycetes bacterium]|nr:hypothetical protein [Planctomycetota bacterium]